MKTCAYCGSEVHIHTEAYCSFCEMILPLDLVQEDGYRKKLSSSHALVSLGLADRTTPELMTLATFELLHLLKMLRQKRSDAFNLMRILKKANGQVDDFQNAASSSGKDYEWWTRKMWIVENILRDRMDHYPMRISDDYLMSLVKQIKQSNEKPMTVRSGN
ncbi:hypothetical protein J6TS7_29610 [Paenibacillus dendritiformis]|uniref:hypothetical protein n=1 Tax=Paenibacillus TaxID=44249 RepID=UPI001B06BBF2|nr:hypothetical protein [Paenibacillus dendritiformis]GIO79351.1 hypothetical protein J6TS7_29610 [Paenibacillus dendritiformis]